MLNRDDGLSAENRAALRALGAEMHMISASDVERAFLLESASYPEDEAATLDKLVLRQRDAGAYFWGAFDRESGTLVGFTCGTLCRGAALTHESMSQHDPQGSTLCVHSVCVEQSRRRRGLATAMLKSYVESVALGQPNCAEIRLICKAPLLGLYARCGFSIVGQSDVVHGADPWFEMGLALEETAPRMLPFVQVDAFTSTPFCGNSAAVVFTHNGGNSKWMQTVAMEMNLSETAFVEPAEPTHNSSSPPPASVWSLRWFTPVAEVDLCGHATLAAAHALWETGRAAAGRAISFRTLSGELLCRRSPDAPGFTELDFPAEPAEGPIEAPPGMAVGLGLELEKLLFVGRNRVDCIVEVSREAFSRLKPDFTELRRIEARGVIVTCAATAEDNSDSSSCGSSNGASGASSGGGGGYDFLSRFFAPRFGIDEDPVTGSAHCCLAPFWGRRLGRSALQGRQASARGGDVRMLWREETGRVVILGEAVTVLTGLLRRT